MAWTAPRTWTTGELVTAPIMNAHVRDNLDILKTSIDDTGDISFTDATELTIASDAITVTQNYHKVDTQSDAASDDLSTITAGASVRAGHVLVLRAENVARVVTVKDGVGNILLNGGDLQLNATDKLCVLIYDGTNWRGGSLVSTGGGGGIPQSFSGLHLRTSPNADVAATTVTLLHADSIVLEDVNTGLPVVAVGPWDDLSAVITTAGAGGLDTGTEAASTHYGIYAIRKSGDGTKNLLLHRAKNYNLDEQQTTDTSNEDAINSTNTRTAIAQTFDTDLTGYVEFVDIKIGKDNSPTGQMWCEILATSAGTPTGAALATSDKLNIAALPAGANPWVRFVFRSPVSLTAGTTYALVFTGNHAASDTVNIHWNENNVGGYAAGEQYKKESGSWAAFGEGDDFCFKVYITENDAAVTMPSGYNQKCLIGYVYNDSGSNFNQFVAIDREVQFLAEEQSLGTTTATVHTLFDLSGVIPPGPVIFRALLINNTVGDNVFMYGVPDGFDSIDAYRGAVTIVTASGANYRTPAAQQTTEYQGMYFWTAVAGTADIYPAGYRW